MARFVTRQAEVEAVRWEAGVEWPERWKASRFVPLGMGTLLVQTDGAAAFSVALGHWIVEMEPGRLVGMTDDEFRQAFVVGAPWEARSCQPCVDLTFTQDPATHHLCGRCLQWFCFQHLIEHVSDHLCRGAAADEHLPPGALRSDLGGTPGGA